MIVRRNGDGWKNPFVSVFSADGVKRKFTRLISEKTEFAGVKVETPALNNRTEIILAGSGDDGYSPEKGTYVEGNLGVICFDDSGLQYLFLGNGEEVSWNGYTLKTAGDWTNAVLYRKNGELYYSSTLPVWIAKPGEKRREYPAGMEQKL